MRRGGGSLAVSRIRGAVVTLKTVIGEIANPGGEEEEEEDEDNE